ncbi:hypothetical protein [Enterococcus hailinensis]|uniref:hypothetical protein n=1 Tax=Enterococcus hailinensis TaxID=3238988 RepID=UPI0038B36E73
MRIEIPVRLVPTDEKFYISITDKNYELLDKPDGTIIEDKKQQYQKTFSAQTVIGESGTEYYELSNLADHVVGYIRPISAEVVEGNQGKFYSENNVYASIDSPNVDLLNEQFQKQGTTEKIMNQTFKIDGYYNHFDGTTYYLLSDMNNQKIGLVTSIALKISENPFGKANIVNDYYTVIKDDQKIWTNLEFTEVGTTEKIMNQTFNVKEWYYHLDGKKYYALYDNSANFKGFVEENTIKKAVNPGGIWHSADYYVSITKNNWTIWKDFNFKNGNSTKDLYQGTYKVTGYYKHFNGAEYLSIYDNNGDWLGYLNAEGAQVVNDPGGKWNSTNQYVTITKNNWTIWKDFNFKSGSSTKNLYQRTYRATGWYRHYNGSKYLSIYDNSGKWLGYLNAEGAQVTNNPGGKWNSTSQYATVNKSNWTIWKDFNFKSGSSTKNLYQRTYRATGWYRHYNGSKYLSIYDNSGKWLGYLNAEGAQVTNNPGGKWNSTSQYATVNKSNWTIWKDFNFKNGTSTKNLNTKTYKVTGWYRHYNGSKYLSIYDNNGKWQGYLNADGATTVSGAQGTGFSTNKSVLVIKNGYSIWNNFNWNEKTRTNSLINKTYQVKWYYKHMNGSTYYSLYEANGKWFGYVNSDAVRERKGAASYLGTTRQRVVNELSAHQNDRFYFGTPYRGLSSSNPEPFLSPYGAPNAYGPGMNCTGFVACVMRRSGGNLNRISGITQGWGSYANAYNWRDALMRNTEYYTFNSVDALLKSGKAQKGDIIYFDPVWTDINYDCHIGIFWGNSSTENKIWHQVLAGNMTSNIFSGTRFSKIYLFPQD